MPEISSPIDNQGGRAPLRRDTQQWVLDYLIQETGKVFHFQGEGRGELPKSVHSHAMISKHVGRGARKLEELADTEYAAGHGQTALGVYFRAAFAYGRAHHPVFELNDEKRFLYDGLRRCFDKVMELAPYPIEHVHVEWEGTTVSGILHLNPDVDGPAPLLFYIPGCDNFKESFPHPQFNVAHQRGMHAFSFDGPGQPESNMRGIKLTADNYERAGAAVLDVLLARPEIDAEKTILYANSFGSFWGMRLAAHDDRFAAVAATQASLCDKYVHTDLESPRWKQLFAFLTQAEDEAELDRVMQDMTMEGYMERITAPLFMTVGEYDPRAPLDEVYPLFEQLTVPAELWVMADQHHNISMGDRSGPGWARSGHGFFIDWLKDRIDGKPVERPGEVLWVDGDLGPNSSSVQEKRHWYET